MAITNFIEANKILAEFTPKKGLTKESYTLDRMFDLMNFLGNPQNQLKIIHVAGTSGKTSTAYYLASLLGATGKKVGLTVSPHIAEINERVQINLIPLPEAEFCRELSVFLDLVEKSKIEPSYFELLVAFAFWEFERQKVDYAVIEVGLGGLLDGTNVIDRTDKLCVITDIGLDHMQRLGKTISAISEQKAGIIGKRNVVFTYFQSSVVNDVFKRVSKKQHAQLHEIDDHRLDQSLDFLPKFQRRNLGLAIKVIEYMLRRDKLGALSKEQIFTAAKIKIPGRMEVFAIRDKTLILDGAHNAQKLRALVLSIREKFPTEPIAVLVSLSSNAPGAIEEISRLTRFSFITTFSGGQDLPRHSIDTKSMEILFKMYGIDSKVIVDPKKALKKLLKRREKILLVTGSFFLLNELRPIILSM